MNYGNYPDLSNIKKILIIKLRHHGDVLLSTPVVSSLKAKYPGAQIDAFIYKETLPMLKENPNISHFFLYDSIWKKLSFFKKIKKELSIFRSIANAKYDLVINLTEGDRGALAAFFSKARIKVGFDPEKKGFFGKKLIYTHVVKNCKTPRHAVERNLDALRKIGIIPEKKELSFFYSKESLLKMLAMTKNQKFILIHPASRWKFKCLPPYLIRELIEKLLLEGHQIVLTASPDKNELAMIEEIVKNITPPLLLNFAGKISLEELGALISLSKVVVCVDSVPLHLCSSLKTPVVALFGPTSDKDWGPWMHPKAHVIASKIPCRPCGMDGCGGSKISACLYDLSADSIKSQVISIMKNN